MAILPFLRIDKFATSLVASRVNRELSDAILFDGVNGQRNLGTTTAKPDATTPQFLTDGIFINSFNSSWWYTGYSAVPITVVIEFNPLGTPAVANHALWCSRSGSAGSGGLYFRYDPAGNLQLLKSQVAQIVSTAFSPKSNGSIVAFTYDGTNYKIAADGVLLASGVGAQSCTFGQASIGAEGGAASLGGDVGNSAFRSLFVSPRVLSDSELVEATLNPHRKYLESFRNWIIPPNNGITFDAAANSGYQAAASTYTFNRTVSGTNRFLAIDVSLLSAGQTVTSIVDDFGGTAVNAVFVGAQSTVSSVGRVEMWRVINPVAGTKSIQVNLSGSIASSTTAVSYSGVHQSSPTEGFNSAQATNVGAADATVNITTVADNCWVHGSIATNDTAITANQTTRNNVSGVGGSGANEDNNAPKTPAGSVTMSYTGVDALSTWAIGGYAIRPVAASGLGGTVFTASLLNGLSSAGKFFRNPLG